MRRQHLPEQEPVEGFTVFSSEAVEDQELSRLASDLFAYAIQAIDRKGGPYKPGPAPYKPLDMYELMLSDEVKPEEAVLWLGKAQQAYGGDFGSLDLNYVTASNRTTDEIATRLPALSKGGLRFVFVVEGETLTEAQDRRADLLKSKLGELAIPAMRLRSSIVPPAEILGSSARSADATDEALLHYFTIDDTLEYPLVLRRLALPEPSSGPDQLSLID